MSEDVSRICDIITQDLARTHVSYYSDDAKRIKGHTVHRGWARLLLNRARDLTIHEPAHHGANGAAMPTDEDDFRHTLCNCVSAPLNLLCTTVLYLLDMPSAQRSPGDTRGLKAALRCDTAVPWTQGNSTNTLLAVIPRSNQKKIAQLTVFQLEARVLFIWPK